MISRTGETQAMSFACMACGGTASTPFLTACPDYYLRKPLVVDYVGCDRCGLVQQFPLPGNVASFYDEYPVHRKKGWLHRTMRGLVMGGVYLDVRRYGVRLDGPSILVDYGCGDGWFLESARARGLEVAGFEPEAKHARQLATLLNLDVTASRESLLREYGGKCDVVTMHFVLEHVTNLDEAIETARDLLKPGGLLYVAVPDVRSWEARLFRSAWHGLDAPRHISFPDMQSIRQLAKRWGFEVSSIRKLPFPNGVAGSLATILTRHFSFPLFLGFLPIGIVLARVFPGGAAAYFLTRVN